VPDKSVAEKDYARYGPRVSVGAQIVSSGKQALTQEELQDVLLFRDFCGTREWFDHWFESIGQGGGVQMIAKNLLSNYLSRNKRRIDEGVQMHESLAIGEDDSVYQAGVNFMTNQPIYTSDNIRRVLRRYPHHDDFPPEPV
jgi:hypothetical protein